MGFIKDQCCILPEFRVALGLGQKDAVGHELDARLLAEAFLKAHLIADEAAERVADHVRRGMGLVALHSAHFAKPFRLLMGTSCTLKWRDGDRERIWTVQPGHPIAAGVPEHFELAEEEMYGEPFDIPAPDELVFLSWFAGGEVMRSGCVLWRGRGKVFYFRPGHETNPTYHDPNVRRILGNAAAYVAPTSRSGPLEAPKAEALEPKR